MVVKSTTGKPISLGHPAANNKARIRYKEYGITMSTKRPKFEALASASEAFAEHSRVRLS